jgi:hypothetical protein
MAPEQTVLSVTLETKFRRLVNAWKAGRGFSSSAAKMAMHPAYLQIIGMGPAAIPLLLEELSREPDHWFIALQSITGIDPVPTEVRGRMDLMAQAWQEWGKSEGYLTNHGA